MKKVILLAVFLALALGGCTKKSSNESADSANKAKVYKLEDVNQEMTQGGIQAGASRETVQGFFKDRPAYHVCQDSEAGFIVVRRTNQAPPKPNDQYSVSGKKGGGFNWIDPAPPQFSAGN